MGDAPCAIRAECAGGLVAWQETSLYEFDAGVAASDADGLALHAGGLCTRGMLQQGECLLWPKERGAKLHAN